MGLAQEKTEMVLRNIHILFSKAEPFNGSKKRVVVDKNKMMDLLKELNACLFDLQEEYEMTQASRDRAERELQKKGDDMLFDARKDADDIYAASLMYTDSALGDIQKIIEEANEKMAAVLESTRAELKEAKQTVKLNQSDLKSRLQDMIDTDKYLKLIEEENERRKKAEKKGKYMSADKMQKEESPYAAIKPEIKINEDYFRQQGIPLNEEAEKKEADEAAANLSDDLDNEYFAWKEGAEGA